MSLESKIGAAGNRTHRCLNDTAVGTGDADRPTRLEAGCEVRRHRQHCVSLAFVLENHERLPGVGDVSLVRQAGHDCTVERGGDRRVGRRRLHLLE